MNQPVPPIQPPRRQYQPPAPKPVNKVVIAAMAIIGFVAMGLTIWLWADQERKLAGPGVDDPMRREILIAAGHDPDDYPHWPLVFDDHYEAVREEGIVFIKGKITNQGKKHYDFVEVDLHLYNEDGHMIGKTSDSISNLAPGETWVYRAIPFARNWKTCKVVNISAY